MDVPAFCVSEVEFYERAVTLRMPFRFGAATLTECPQAFVRARIELADGRGAHGAAAELMIPKWFDKSPNKSNDDNIADLRTSLRNAAAAYAATRNARSAFGHFAAHYKMLIGAGAAAGLDPLVANYGPALLDRAILDALCRLFGLPFHGAIRSNLTGIDTSLTPDLDAFDISRFLADLKSSKSIAARHTVGLLDPLTSSDGLARISDGLPETLEEVIAAYGNQHFKVKLAGDPDADVDRLVCIAEVLDQLPHYEVTLDGNEQYQGVGSIAEFWRRMAGTAALARLDAATLYMEQPLARGLALDADVSALARIKPLLIDESDATLDAFPAARQCGYEGVSSKSCKGVYKSILNAARCARWNAEASTSRYFLSAEDLTMQAGIAVQQDLALVATLGLRHVERNGHHYVNGFAGQGADEREQQAFLNAQPGLYESSAGSVRLAFRDGRIDLTSLAAPGFASRVHPEWATLEPLGAALSSGSQAVTQP